VKSTPAPSNPMKVGGLQINSPISVMNIQNWSKVLFLPW
jgi:hypothetical protein